MTSRRGMLSADEHDSASVLHCVAAAAADRLDDVLLEILLEIQSLVRNHYLPLPPIHSFCCHPSLVVFSASRRIPALGPCPCPGRTVLA